MVKLENISLRNYGPQHLRAGDVFEATSKHATLLIAIGKCRAHKEAIAKPEVVIGMDLANINDEVAMVEVAAPRKKRTYKRKDMVAE